MTMKYITTVEDQNFTIDVDRQNEVALNGESRAIDMRAIDNAGLYSMLLNGKSVEVLVEESDGEYRVMIDGVLYHVKVVDERTKRLAEAAGAAFGATGGEVNIKSPMPGLIVAIPVKEGQSLKKGQVVVVLESMKMENEIKAPRDATVTSIKVNPRQTVEQGQLLVTMS